MDDLDQLIEDMQQGEYDPQYNNHHYLSYEVENAAKNVKKLAKSLKRKEKYKQGLRFAKMGLYLSIFEDKNAKIFFKEALRILRNLATEESTQLIDYLTNYNIDQPIDLEGEKSDSKFKAYFGGKWHKETFEKTVKDFNRLRKDAWRDLFNKRQFFSQDMEECFKSTIKSMKRKQERFEYELTELKDEYQINKNKLEKRLDKLERSVKRKTEEKFLQNYQKNELLKLAKLSSEEFAKLPEGKKNLVEKLRKQYQDIKEDIQESEFSTKEQIWKEKEQLNEKYKNDVKELKKNYIKSNNIKKAFFEEMENDKLASYFGKDFIRIFGIYGLDFETERLWSEFIDLEFKNKEIQESYDRLVAKLKNEQQEFQKKKDKFIDKVEDHLDIV